MDIETLLLGIAISRNTAGTVENYAERAEAAADLAQAYGYYLEFGDNETITVGSQEES